MELEITTIDGKLVFSGENYGNEFCKGVYCVLFITQESGSILEISRNSEILSIQDIISEVYSIYSFQTLREATKSSSEISGFYIIKSSPDSYRYVPYFNSEAFFRGVVWISKSLGIDGFNKTIYIDPVRGPSNVNINDILNKKEEPSNIRSNLLENF